MYRVLIAFVVLLASCATKKETSSFTIQGVLKNTPARMVYLQESQANSGAVIIDSSVIDKNGKYLLTGTSKEEAIYSVRTQENPYPFALLINDSHNITLNADLSNNKDPYTVDGSPASAALADFDRNTMSRASQIYNLSRELDSLVRAKAPDTVINLPFSRYENLAAELKTYTSEFINQAKSPMLVLYAFGGFQRLAEQLQIKKFSSLEQAEIINKAAERFPGHQALAELKKKQRSRQAPDFSMSDTSGKAVALSSFRGKYVLVDFWASWCGPCRDENPNVVSAFNRFKEKNFTILGVSLDKNRAAWLQAIQHDQLTWNHVSDLQYWNNAAATLYEVRSIPYNILIDPQGNIIGEDLRGQDLHKALEKVLK
jgi:peroxiredoxin